MRRIAIPALLVALALVQGCNDDDPTTPTGPGTSTPEGSPASPGSTTTSSSPSVDAATGIRLSMPNSTVRAPSSWSHAPDLTRTEDGADSPDGFSYVVLGEIDAFSSTASAGQLADNRIKANLYQRAPRKLPLTELAGAEAYHLAGFVDDHQYLEEFGTIVRDRIVTLTFSFDEEVPKSDRDEVVASVLPTFAWK